MASNVRFLDNVKVGAYGNSSATTTDTGSFMITGSVDGNNKLTFTKGDGSTFDIQVEATSSSADSLVTASISGQTLTFTKGDDSTFPITIPTNSVSTGSLLTTGSVNLNTLTFTKGDGSTFGLTVDTGSGGSATLSQALTANLTVGGVTSGETFTQGSSIEALLRDMLITYQEPTLSSLSVKSGGSAISTSTRDVGESFSCDNATFTAGVDSPNGDFPQSASLSCTGADIGSFSETGPNNVQASNTITFSTTRTISKATAAGSVTFTVSTTSRNSGDTQSTSRSFSFQFRNYLAASSTIISDGTTLQSVLDNDVVQSPFDTNRIWTATCNASNDVSGNFTYIIYPASYGNLSEVIQNSATPVLGAFTKLGDFTANNNQGSSLSWRVYKSNADKAFASGVTLAIT